MSNAEVEKHLKENSSKDAVLVRAKEILLGLRIGLDYRYFEDLETLVDTMLAKEKNRPSSKVIQISASSAGDIALCEDGSIWSMWRARDCVEYKCILEGSDE